MSCPVVLYTNGIIYVYSFVYGFLFSFSLFFKKPDLAVMPRLGLKLLDRAILHQQPPEYST